MDKGLGQRRVFGDARMRGCEDGGEEDRNTQRAVLRRDRVIESV